MKYVLLFLLCCNLTFSKNDSILKHGENLIYKNKLDDAIAFYNKQLLNTKDSKQEVQLYFGLADVYKYKLNYNEANRYYSEAYSKIKSLNDIQMEFLYYVKIAEFYRKRTLFLEASQQINKASLILKKHKIDTLNYIKYLSRKAAIHTEYYIEPDSTLFYSQKALELANRINDKDNIFYSTLEISGVYEQKREFKKALKYLEELIAYSQKNDLLQQISDAYVNYTRVLIKDEQLKKGLEESIKALEFARKNKQLFNEVLFTDNIRNIHKKLGNVEEAYNYLETRLKLTDEYYKKEHNKYLFELEEKYKLTEKENEIKINTLEIQNKNKALASNNIKLIISISLLTAVIFLTALISYFLKKEKNSNKRLQSLSSENQFLLSEANHRINNNLQLVVILISDQLKKNTSTDNFQLKSILTKVEAISTLHKHLYKNEDKRKVDAQGYLNDVKDSFFDLFKENNIQTNFTISSIKIPSDYAMYFGLLLTELSINSIKHAFQNQENKTIHFELKRKDNMLVFYYSDNGLTSLNKAIKPKLVDQICRQMEMKYKINTVNGFNFLLEKEITND